MEEHSNLPPDAVTSADTRSRIYEHYSQKRCEFDEEVFVCMGVLFRGFGELANILYHVDVSRARSEELVEWVERARIEIGLLKWRASQIFDPRVGNILQVLDSSMLVRSEVPKMEREQAARVVCSKIPALEWSNGHANPEFIESLRQVRTAFIQFWEDVQELPERFELIRALLVRGLALTSTLLCLAWVLDYGVVLAKWSR